MRVGFPPTARRGTMHPVRLLGLVLALLLLAAAPASATVRKGTGTDEQSTNVAAGNDLLGYGASADDATGTVVAAVQLRAAPAETVVVRVGTLQGTGCTGGVIFQVRGGAAVWFPDGQPSSAKPAQLEPNGASVAVGAQDPVLAKPFDCVEAGTAKQDGSLLDETGVTTLAADPPPPPPPTTTAAPASPPPPPTTATAPPVAVPQAAKLSLSLTGTPRTVKRNRTISLKLRIANDGSKPTGKLSLARPAARGLSVVTLARSLAALKPGAKKTVTVRVKLTSRARSSTPVRLTVSSGKLKASSSVQLKLGTAKKAAPATKDTPGNPLVGTYWWRTEVHADRAWDNRALYFVDAKTVYSGFPKGGLPKTCTTPPAEPEEEFDSREGCLPYTYDAKTGAVTIGEKAGTFKSGELKFDDDEFEPLALAAPGARFDFKDHEQTSFFGLCGVYSTCTISYEYLTLTAAGEFVTDRASTTASDSPTSYVQAGSFPPDQRGTYEIRAGGVIRLTYANGTVKDETFAVQTKSGKPEPVTEGVMVGDVNYYPDP